MNKRSTLKVRIPAFSMQQGFTLIEISIVLMVIGLIVGGILVGADMIRQTKIRKLINITTTFNTAINTFRLKYNSIPGEFFTYQSYFPTLVGPYCPKTSNMTITNNNGMIDGAWEAEAAFAQLHAAGLITMGLPQILQDGTVQDHYDCGYNFMQQSAAFLTPFDNVYGKIVASGNLHGLSFGASSVAVLTVGEAIGLENKLGDDGFADTGRVRALRSNTVPGKFCTSADLHSYNPASLSVLDCYIQIYGVN